METRRQFLKNAALFAGATGLSAGLLDSIERAAAIESNEGASFWDAEHVVILMQENRSFDHAFGSLQGVRGFNDPRAITLADGNPVWLQKDKSGRCYAPFRLNMKDSRATWMGSIPHSWTDQVDARNNGLYDGWIEAKRSGHPDYADMPLTLGYFTREDIPFYYALADAFTICDQNFCSSLTGTTANRLHLWTGTIRAEQNSDSPAMVLNSDVDYPNPASWTTFPERLEDLGVSWKIYQNELTVGVGFEGEEDPWLANFGDNPIEYFSQFHVRFAPAHYQYLEARLQTLHEEVEVLKKRRTQDDLSPEEIKDVEAATSEKLLLIGQLEKDCAVWNTDAFERLSEREKSLHEKAFCTNIGDPDYHELTTFAYREGDATRTVQIPKGDLLHQFRRDVVEGNLPTVSWVVPPERLSDHPSSAWYGAWYIAELLDILTENPEVWKKTIFILTYDENDGYFDHVPPFVSPHPRNPSTGRVSQGIETVLEYVELDQELKRKPSNEARESPIGLGYRVPMIVASPWTTGGCVCSQVFDHTSPLQFLEKFLSKKTGKQLVEPNINTWRRTVCGDLTSVFQSTPAKVLEELPFSSRDEFVAEIHRSQFKEAPVFEELSSSQIEQIRRNPLSSALLPKQEKGYRRSCPLPYELAVEGVLSDDKHKFIIRFASRNNQFGKNSAGAPFVVYQYLNDGTIQTRNYAVSPGDQFEDEWWINETTSPRYDLRVYGPNGFYRQFKGDKNGPSLEVTLEPTGNSSLNGGVVVSLSNKDENQTYFVTVKDPSYKSGKHTVQVAQRETSKLTLETRESLGWYDLILSVEGFIQFQQHYAGRVETGMWSITDPAMGRVGV